MKVWRATRDRHGDKSTNTLVGEQGDVLLDHHAASPGDGFEETSSSSTVMFLPRDGIKVEDRDRITLDGNTYAVIGGRMWDEPHPVTGYRFSHYMVKVDTTT